MLSGFLRPQEQLSTRSGAAWFCHAHPGQSLSWQQIAMLQVSHGQSLDWPRYLAPCRRWCQQEGEPQTHSTQTPWLHAGTVTAFLNSKPIQPTCEWLLHTQSARYGLPGLLPACGLTLVPAPGCSPHGHPLESIQFLSTFTAPTVYPRLFSGLLPDTLCPPRFPPHTHRRAGLNCNPSLGGTGCLGLCLLSMGVHEDRCASVPVSLVWV